MTTQVQSGGSFDVDYTVVGPNDKIIMSNPKERQGDFVFTAQDAGEYRVCFNNEMSTFAEKMVDFEIAVRPLLNIQITAFPCPFLYSPNLFLISTKRPAFPVILSHGSKRVFRSKMKPGLPYRKSKAQPLNKHRHWKSQSSSSQANSRLSIVTRSTSGPVRIETSAPYGVRKKEFSISRL